MPIWFLLIGFSGGRSVPSSWFILGAGLTGLDIWVSGGLSGNVLNILFSFAAIRRALPVVETRIWPYPWRLAALTVLLLLAAPLADMVVEYGTEGVLLAFVGVAHRHWLAVPTRNTFAMRIGFAAVAGVVFVTLEAQDYGFDHRETLVLAFLVAAVSIGLLSVRRGDLPCAVPGPLSDVLICLGRYSLWFYAGQLVLLTLLGQALEITPAGESGQDDA